MPRKTKRGRKRNRGWFRRGKDPRRSTYRFTKEDCKRGYLAALDKAMDAGWDRLAWFTRLIMKHYKEKKREQKEERVFGPTDGIPF